MANQSVIETVVNLCKRRGLVYPCGEIYGGTRSAWDYGPLGVELKENIKKQWWRAMVTSRADVVGLDSSVILPRQVWVSSGHLEVFTDPLVESLHTHKRYRADHLLEAYEEKHGHPPANGLADINDPETGQPGNWTEPKEFSGMLKTFLGPVDDEEGLHYLRPETAQGIFVNFKNVMTTARMKPPFGIAQIGKSFRNEITPGNFIFRTREFEQMEMEFFVKPGTDEEWHQYWIDQRFNWYVDLGINPDNLRLYEHPQEKLSHYSKRTVDIEYAFHFANGQWGELEGIANRTDFDLSTHAKGSGEDLSYFDPYNNTKYVPYVIEPSVGLTRLFLAALTNAYTEIENNEGKRVVMRFAPAIAPIKVAIYPLVKKFANEASELYELLSEHFVCEYDEAGTIGKRYQRSEEMGIPFAIAVEPENYNQGQVTVRFRDSGEQEIVKIENLVAWLKEKGC